MDKSKAYAYYQSLWWDHQNPEWQVAFHMSELHGECPGLTTAELYDLGCKLLEAGDNCTEPFLAAELRDAVRWVMEYGFHDGQMDFTAAQAAETLLTAPQRTFEYIIFRTAAENQGRYASDPPSIPVPAEELHA